MYENGGEIIIRGKTYPLLFNVAALKEVGARYGGLTELGEKLKGDYGRAIDEFIWIITLLIAQGIALKNFEDGTKEKAPTRDEVELLMLPAEIFASQDVIMQVINAGMDSGSAGEDEDEEVDEVLQEVLASKNGEGAGE